MPEYYITSNAPYFLTLMYKLNQAGVRKSMLTGGFLFGSGFAIASAGVLNHNIGKKYFKPS